MHGNDSPVTSDVILRTFRIQSGKSGGTAFTVVHNGQQYLVTALHVARHNGPIYLRHAQCWKLVPTVSRLVDGGSDLAVYELGQNIGHPSSIRCDTEFSLNYSQRCRLLGFPYGWEGRPIVGSIDAGFPRPFVKEGIISQFGDNDEIWLDAHGNPGFSGGPVVARSKEGQWEVVAYTKSWRGKDAITGFVVAGFLNRVQSLIESGTGERAGTDETQPAGSPARDNPLERSNR